MPPRARVQTGSRLHFGFLNVARDAEAAGGARRFGGVGLMIEEPGVEVVAEAREALHADGPLASRLVEIARRYWQAGSHAGQPAGPHAGVALRVLRAPPEHIGLGTGTQLALAVGRAMQLLQDAGGSSEFAQSARRVSRPRTLISAAQLAVLADRGARSAIGVHGFERGGLLVDGGKSSSSPIAPLVARLELPDAWRVVLILPPAPPGLHSDAERRAFEHLPAMPEALADRLCRLVLLGLLPAAAEADFEGFGGALEEFGRRVGEFFAPLQGGAYAAPGTADLIARLHATGAPGVAQTSWGPTLFAPARDPEHAEHLKRAAVSALHAAVEAPPTPAACRTADATLRPHVWITRPRNRGASGWQGAANRSR